MSQPDDSTNYITCSCQHCNGHIKFDGSLLRPGETARIECPHCHIETVIFNKTGGSNPNPASEADSLEKKARSSKIELFLFELTRFPTVAGAILVLFAFGITAIFLIQTRIPEKPQKPPVISYEMVAPAPKTAMTNDSPFAPRGSKMASKKSFPQPVIDFLLKHQGFALKEWLNQLDADQRQAYLNNLAAFLTTMNSKYVAEDNVKQLVSDFSDMWIGTLKEEAVARERKEVAKQAQFTQLTTVAFGLFISMMTLSLVLVLLAIERNTRFHLRPKVINKV